MDYAPKVTLEGVNGEVFKLSSREVTEDVWLRRGAKGLDSTEWDVQVDEFPVLDGEYPRAVRGQAREVFLPLTMYGTTRPAMVAAKRRLLRAVNPSRVLTRYPRLIVAESNELGEYEPERELDVYYSGGLEGDEGEENGLNWAKVGLVLRSAGSPFWQDRQDTLAEFYTYDVLRPFYQSPFLSPDGLSGGFGISSPPEPVSQIVVANPGDVSVFPSWTVAGPITGPFNLVREATAYSPQRVLTFNNTFQLDEGESATIVTRPGQMRVTTSVGADLGWSVLSTNPQFWPLDPGTNQVSVQALTGGATASQFFLTFRAKYLGM